MEFSEWEQSETMDEAELDAIEAAAMAEFLSSSAKRRNPSNRSVPGQDGADSDASTHLNPTDNSIAGEYGLDTDAYTRPRARRRLPSWGVTASAAHLSGCRSPVDAIGQEWMLGSPSCREQTQVRYPIMTFGGRIVYRRTPAEVEKATFELLEFIKSNNQHGERVSVGFDIEWRPTFRRGETPRKAAVIQLCADNTHCYVMHISHSGIPPILQSFLEDKSSVKVGISIANDAVKILRDYNVHVETLEDLSGLANLKLGGVSKKWSLSSLTEMLTCKQLAKPSKVRLGNWEADVLSREQLLYAATDAFVSWYLYQVLKGFPDASDQDGKIDQVSVVD